jgi:hypothetical protein
MLLFMYFGLTRPGIEPTSYRTHYCRIISVTTYIAIHQDIKFITKNNDLGGMTIILQLTKTQSYREMTRWCNYWCARLEFGNSWVQFPVWFVSDLRQIGGFLRVLRFPPVMKLTATI